MGHSVSLDRDRSTDLNHFLQVNQPSNNDHQPQQQQQPLEAKQPSLGWTGRRKHLSTLFSLPVDTFVHITRYLPLVQVVQDLTCVHPFLYEIMYHPHNVDALWNGRYLNNEASAVNNDYLMCLDSDTVSSIASFLAKSKLSHFRIHLRQWNEEHLIKVLKAAQSNAIEMHITAFENRLNITQLTKWPSDNIQFTKLTTFSCQNHFIRSRIVHSAPLLSHYDEFRVHYDQQFDASSLLCHPNIEALTRITIKGTAKEGHNTRGDADGLVTVLERAINLTHLDLSFTVIPLALLSSIFKLQELKSLSLGHCTLGNYGNEITGFNAGVIERCATLPQLTDLKISFMSNLEFVGSMLKKTASTLKYFTIRNCNFRQENDLPHLGSFSAVSIVSQSALQPKQMKTLLKYSTQLKHLVLHDASEHGFSDIMSAIPKSIEEFDYRPFRTGLLPSPLRILNPAAKKLKILGPRDHGFHYIRKADEVTLTQNLLVNSSAIYFTKLRSLEIIPTIFLGDLRALALHCPKLEHLHLDCLDTQSHARLPIFENLKSFELSSVKDSCTQEQYLALAICCGPMCTTFKAKINNSQWKVEDTSVIINAVQNRIESNNAESVNSYYNEVRKGAVPIPFRVK